MFPGPRSRRCLRRLLPDGRARRDRTRRWRPLLRTAGIGCGVLLLGWWALPHAYPIPDALDRPPHTSPVLLDRSGAVLADFPREDFFRHESVRLDRIPKTFIDATLVAEDKRFYRHDGMDYLAMARAVRDLLRERRVISGASTITQQLVKISSPPAPRSVPTKIREGLTARHLETARTKDQILEAYLNRLDYGNRRQGCLEAARHYFRKPLQDLSLAECALLAGLPQSPSLHDPRRNPSSALRRRDWILTRLQTECGYDPARIAAARREPLLLDQSRRPNPAPHLAAGLRHSGHDPDRPRIRTTIDGDLQRAVNTIVREELTRLEESNVHHAAVVVLENRTGEILALVGSGDYRDPRGGQINGALAPRSAGSTLKPFTYLLAFENRGLFPGSIVADIPTPYRTPEGLDLPANFDRRHHGPVTIRRALAGSLNVSAMRVLNDLGGPQPLHTLLRRLGLTTLDLPAIEYGLGLTIGNAEVRLLELTNAYATLARLGLHRPVRLRRESSSPGAPPEQILGPQSSYLVADILADNGARAGAFGHDSSLRLPFRCAAKTGTSSDFRDNWCLGFTADLTVGVWVGNFDATPMRGTSGVSGAGPIFHRTMLASHRDRSPAWLLRPGRLQPLTIDTRTGHRFLHPPGPGRPHTAPELCLRGLLPDPVKPSDYDPGGRALLDARYREWFDSDDNNRRGAFALDTRVAVESKPEIVSPIPAAVYLLDPELPSGGNRLRLRSNLPGPAAWSSPTLRIDGDTALLEPGRHEIILTDRHTGSSSRRTITVESL